MEQNEKVFERLNNKFVELQTEFINLSNEKAKMENDLKSQLKEANETILSLENEVNTLTKKLQEKSILNKKLQKDNSNYENSFGQMKSQIKDYKRYIEEMGNYEIIIQNLKEEKKKTKKEIDLLLNKNRI